MTAGSCFARLDEAVYASASETQGGASMMRITLATAATALAFLLPSLASAEITTDSVRQRAEQACYDDANRLCADAIPDEAKITACMKVHRAQLNPKCRAIFDGH